MLSGEDIEKAPSFSSGIDLVWLALHPWNVKVSEICEELQNSLVSHSFSAVKKILSLLVAELGLHISRQEQEVKLDFLWSQSCSF